MLNAQKATQELQDLLTLLTSLLSMRRDGYVVAMVNF